MAQLSLIPVARQTHLCHLRGISFQLRDESVEQVDDAFQSENPRAIMATRPIKLCEKGLCAFLKQGTIGHRRIGTMGFEERVFCMSAIVDLALNSQRPGIPLSEAPRLKPWKTCRISQYTLLGLDQGL
jgi:hypothetical protein